MSGRDGGSLRRLCVFCGSNTGREPAYPRLAEALARTLAGQGIGIVYGGGRVGLMGVLADAALAAGGEVIGVIPQALIAREIGHRGLTELRIVGSMHERKALMAELADGFVALPGGIGTLEELFEVWTWAQLGLHAKPCGVLDADGFYGPLVAFLDHLVETGFVRPAHRAMLLSARSPEALLEAFAAYRPPQVGKWVEAPAAHLD
ncbi:MAG TPA: TIGR00730 family Rossman fold protein [Gemmatimonadales bacterium]|nr:TIGR00730 family Rossman fold protein [Gemmatimonadales bacterium]